MRQVIFAALLAFFIYVPSAHAQQDHAADHDALRHLLVTSSAAINSGNFDELKTVLSDKDLTIITVDNHKFKSADTFKNYWEKMFGGNASPIKSLKVEPEADDKTIFLSDNVGVVDGTSKETYTFRDGDVRVMNTRWSAVVDKENCNWKIAQIHFSADVMDNPVLSAAKAAAGQNMLLPGIAGFVLGGALMWLLKRCKKNA